jgi:hypothetical protein
VNPPYSLGFLKISSKRTKVKKTWLWFFKGETNLRRKTSDPDLAPVFFLAFALTRRTTPHSQTFADWFVTISEPKTAAHSSHRELAAQSLTQKKFYATPSHNASHATPPLRVPRGLHVPPGSATISSFLALCTGPHVVSRSVFPASS